MLKEPKPDTDGIYHFSRLKLIGIVGLIAFIGLASVISTALTPSVEAKKPCAYPVPTATQSTGGTSSATAVAQGDCIPLTVVADLPTSSNQVSGETLIDNPKMPSTGIEQQRQAVPEATPSPIEDKPLVSRAQDAPPPVPMPSPESSQPSEGATASGYPSPVPSSPSATLNDGPMSIAELPEANRVAGRSALRSPRATTVRLLSASSPKARTVALQSATTGRLKQRSTSFAPSEVASSTSVQLGATESTQSSGSRTSTLAAQNGNPHPSRSTVLENASAEKPDAPRSTTLAVQAILTKPATTTTLAGVSASNASARGSNLGSSEALSAAPGQRSVSVGIQSTAQNTTSTNAAAPRDTNFNAQASPNATPRDSATPTNSKSSAAARTVSFGNAGSTSGTLLEQSSLGQNSYPIGSQVSAKLRFGFLAVEGHDDIPVVAESVDGTVWLGQASINQESRVEIHFRELYIKGKAYLCDAQAYNLDKLPGLIGTSRYEAPNLVADLLQAAVGGINSYVQDLTQRGSSTTNGTTTTNTRNDGPTLGQTVLARVSRLFDIGKDTKAVIRLVEVPADTSFLVIVLPKR